MNLEEINNSIDLDINKFVNKFNILKQCFELCFKLSDYNLILSRLGELNLHIEVPQKNKYSKYFLIEINKENLINISSYGYGTWNGIRFNISVDNLSEELLSVFKDYKILTKNEEIIKDIIK